MTISSNTIKSGPYTGNSSTTSFDYNFKIFADEDLRVVKTVIATGVETDLTLGVDYTVSGAGSDSGGSVAYPVSGSALPSTETLTILSDIDIEQQTDLSNQGAFFPEVHESVFDRLCRYTQQLAEKLSRAIVVDVSSTDTPASLLNAIFNTSTEAAASAASVDYIETLRSIAPSIGRVLYVKGHTSINDGGGGEFIGITGAAAGTYTDDNGITILPTGGDGSAAWVRVYSGAVSARWFGAKGDSATDDATSLAAWLGYCNTNDKEGYLPAGVYLTSTSLLITRPSADKIGLTLKGDGRGVSTLKYTGAASIGNLLELEITGGFSINNRVSGISLDLTGAPSGTNGLRINAGVWRSNFHDMYIYRDNPGTRTGYGVYLGSPTTGDIGSYDNKFSEVYINTFERGLNAIGTTLFGNTVTNLTLSNHYISDCEYNLYVDNSNGLSVFGGQLESATATGAGAYIGTCDTAIFVGGSIESNITGAKGIELGAGAKSVIALLDFFNNSGGNFVSNGGIGHLYKTSTSGFILPAGSEIKLDSDGTNFSKLNFFEDGTADINVQVADAGNAISVRDSSDVEHIKVDVGNNILDLLSGVYVRFNTGANSCGVYYGTGSPEGAVTANIGSTYHRFDGSTGTSFYVKESGPGVNTGWVAK